MSTQPNITLNDGNVIPKLGFGVWQVPSSDTAEVVGTAISTGYRSIDTAAIYGNEVGVGRAIAANSLRRTELFITTKLWNDRHTTAHRAFDESLKRLKLDYLDLYLIHWPKPRQNAYVEAWKALVKLQEEGKAKSIGVSNFTVSHLKRIVDATGVVPSVNQIELHPGFQQKELTAYHAEHGIITRIVESAWSRHLAGEHLPQVAWREVRQNAGPNYHPVAPRSGLYCYSEIGDAVAHPRKFRCVRFLVGR